MSAARQALDAGTERNMPRKMSRALCRCTLVQRGSFRAIPKGDTGPFLFVFVFLFELFYKQPFPEN